MPDDPEYLLGLSKPKPDTPPSKKDGDGPRGSRTENAVGFVGGMILGCFAFLAMGGVVLSLLSAAVAIVYLAGTAVLAIWLATRPGWRGFALGILLPLGLMLLTLGYCAAHPP
jgi:hypothetical protein